MNDTPQKGRVTPLAAYLARHDMKITELARRSGISYQTVHSAVKGYKIRKYSVAKAISEATDGEVTIDALCQN